MAKCVITGKHNTLGQSRTFAMNAPKRTWKPNLQRRRMMIDGKMQTVYISTKALKAMAKNR
jgi:large subunit ribosomal protein L28